MWQAWHFQYLDRGLRKLGHGGVPDVTPRLLRDRKGIRVPETRSVWQAWHFQYLDRGLRNLGDGGVPDVTPRLLRDRCKGFEYLRLDL